MSSDEEDYMSDKFLASLENEKSQLMSRNSDKRALEVLKRKKEMEEKFMQRKKSTKVLEQEKREEGLNSAISSDNKGFAMMARMGYKPGQSIGKSQTGITEPISISLKSSKSGLGKDAPVREYRENMKKHTEFNSTDFRSRLANRKAEQLTQCDLSKSQRVCQQLDSDSGLETPKEPWFWPKVPIEKPETEEDEDQDSESESEEEEDPLPAIEQLEIITDYLRTTYQYCIWCAVKFENPQDLLDNCPGNTRNDH